MTDMTHNQEFDGVVCFGGEDWWYHNRGHIDMQLMRRFAKTWTTLYVNSIVMQKPKVTEGRKFVQKLIRKGKSIFKGAKLGDGGFWVYSPFSLPVHHVSWARSLNNAVMAGQIGRIERRLGISNPLVWVACPAACEPAIKAKKAGLVYQRTDRYEEFPGVDVETIKRFDLRLKELADLTVFASSALYEEESPQCRKALYLDHGVDYELFASAEKDPMRPSDIAGIPGPIIGFYGGFAEHTTDIALLEKLADMLADKSFLLVGQPSPQCDALREKKNVWMLGQRPYEQIPHYGKCFDVAIMPWKRNKWIEACNPIKLKEYLALGKPVVSTPFKELNKYKEVVYEARTPEEFAKAVGLALAENCNALVAARRAKVAESTWDHKVRMLLSTLFPDCKYGEVEAVGKQAE
ncbi:MAG: glycosyltransferase [Phycisphaerales bacterium]|nr:MAG: glycosyltransferase [Phycisphaerales bacterium]